MTTKLAQQFAFYHPQDPFNDLRCTGYVRESEEEMCLNIPQVITQNIIQFSSGIFNDAVTFIEDINDKKAMIMDLQYKQNKEDLDGKSITKFIGINEILSRENKVIWRGYHKYYQELRYKITINAIGPSEITIIVGVIGFEGEHRNEVYGFASDGTTYHRRVDGTIDKFPNEARSKWEKGDQFEIIFNKYCEMRLKGDQAKCDDAALEDFTWRLQHAPLDKLKFFIQLNDKETKITINEVQYFKTDIKNDFN